MARALGVKASAKEQKMIDIVNHSKDLINKIKKLLKMFTSIDRVTIANMYIRGSGVEIGALHDPLRVPGSAKVKYVDRMSLPDLRRTYPEFNSRKLVNVDIIDDGERLMTIKEATQDFVIANHFVEHCQNPIEAIKNMLRVLKVEGVLYLAIPDKRCTFDSARQLTTFEHLMRDFHEGPAWSRKDHFEDFVKNVCKIDDEVAEQRQVDKYMDTDFNIHYHVWDQTTMLDLFLRLSKMFAFEIELLYKNELKGETIFVLRKTGLTD